MSPSDTISLFHFVLGCLTSLQHHASPRNTIPLFYLSLGCLTPLQQAVCISGTYLPRHLYGLWRLEERQRWIPGTPWTNLEAGPADHYFPPVHRALLSECPSEEDWHFRHFPVWVRTSWTNPWPRPSVLPKICRETSANMATGCWSGDQAVGLSTRNLPDSWFCGINQTEDLTCTAVEHWRGRRSTCCHTETEFADQTCYVTHIQ